LENSKTIVNRFSDAASVAESAAQRLVEKLTDVFKIKSEAHLMLTGGTVGIATLAALRNNPEHTLIDFKQVHFWWGEERFVSKMSSDRNALQARNALLNYLDINDSNVHEFPSSDNDLLLNEAAKQFEAHVAAVKPHFDLVLLGMGPDGHVASLFPGKDNLENKNWIISEPDSPKPPKQRLSFTYSALNSADEVWFVVAGADKQDAVAVAMGDTPEVLPVGKVHGTLGTQWFIDSTAGTKAFGC
jgi:6-phosphogluconolactonase